MTLTPTQTFALFIAFLLCGVGLYVAGAVIGTEALTTPGALLVGAAIGSAGVNTPKAA